MNFNLPIIPLTGLYLWLVVAAAAVALLIAVLVLVSVLRFRDRPGAGEPRQTAGNRRLEIGWTSAAVAAVAIVFVFTVFGITSAFSPGSVPDDLSANRKPDIVAVGHQWWWEFQYPGFVTANELHIPVGRPVLVELRTADVIHDFWIPKLGEKMDMIPDHSNYVWLRADASGVYEGACAEYCGLQHAWMRLRAVAQPPQEYAAWTRAQAAPAAAPATPLARQGQQVFAARACGACHAIAGTAANGTAAPSLTHVGSRSILAAGRVPNTPANMAAFIRDPQALKPGSQMPNFHLSEEEIRALTEYLEGLR